MDDVLRFIAAGEYRKAAGVLGRSAAARSIGGVASSAFLLAMAGDFDAAEALLARHDLPGVALIVRGERERLARWSDRQAAATLAAAVPLPYLELYAGIAVAFIEHDAALVMQLKADLSARARPIPGKLHLRSGQVRAFADLADADDAIGQMLETLCGEGLLYFPLAALRRVDFMPRESFVDVLMPKVRLIDHRGTEALAYVPMLYAGSGTSEDEAMRTGRMTTFEYVGRGRRASGQRDFVIDGSFVAIQNITSIELAPLEA